MFCIPLMATSFVDGFSPSLLSASSQLNLDQKQALLHFDENEGNGFISRTELHFYLGGIFWMIACKSNVGVTGIKCRV